MMKKVVSHKSLMFVLFLLGINKFSSGQIAIDTSVQDMSYNVCAGEALIFQTDSTGTGSTGLSWIILGTNGPDTLYGFDVSKTFNIPGTDTLITVDQTVSVLSGIQIFVITKAIPAFDSITVFDNLCFGGTDGVAIPYVFGGTAPYEYSLNGGPYFSSDTLNNLGSGLYSIAARDTNGCSVSTQFLIEQSSEIMLVQIEKDSVSCFGSSDGSISLTAMGGTPPYSFQINGDTTLHSDTLQSGGLSAGSYLITVIDSNNCSYTSTVNIDQPDSLYVQLLSENPVTCFGGGDGSITVQGAGGTPPYMYRIGNGPFQTSNSFSGLNSGFDTVVVRDSKNCENVLNVTITQPNPLNLSNIQSISDDSQYCYEDSVTINIPNTDYGGTGNYRFILEELNGSSWDSINSSTVQSSFTVLASVGYSTYRIKAVDLICLETSVALDVTVLVYEEFVSNSISWTPPTEPFCNGASPGVTLNAQWSGGEGGIPIFQWYSAEPLQNFQPINGATNSYYSPGTLTASTSFYVEITDNGQRSCGIAFSDTITLSVRAPLSAPSLSQPSTVCHYENVQLTIENPSTGGKTPYVYDWYASTNANVFTKVASDTSQFEQTTFSDTTLYFVVAKSTSPCDLDSVFSDTIAVTMYDQLTSPTLVTNTPIATCFSGSITIHLDTVEGGSGGFWYILEQWIGSAYVAVDSSASPSFTRNSLVDTSYLYRLRVKDTFCNEEVSSAGVTISILDEFVVDSINWKPPTEPVCYNESFGDTLWAQWNGGRGNSTFQWFSASGTGAFLPIPNATGSIYIPNSPLTDSLRIYVAITDFGAQLSSSCGFKTSDTITIPVRQQLLSPSFLAPSVIPCFGDSISLNIVNKPTGGKAPYVYYWYASTDSLQWTMVTDSSSQHKQSAIFTTTWYYLSAVSSSPCTSDTVYSDTIKVNVFNQLVATPTIISDDVICYKDSTTIYLDSNVINWGGTGNYLFNLERWSSSAWYSIDTNTTPQFIQYDIDSTSYYRIVVKDTSCYQTSSAVSDTILVNFEFITDTISWSGNNITCYNSAPDKLTANWKGGQLDPPSFNWFVTDSLGIFKHNPIDTNEIYFPAPLKQVTSFYVQIDDECGSGISDTITIGVNSEIAPGGFINHVDSTAVLWNGSHGHMFNFLGHNPADLDTIVWSTDRNGVIIQSKKEMGLALVDSVEDATKVQVILSKTFQDIDCEREDSIMVVSNTCTLSKLNVIMKADGATGILICESDVNAVAYRWGYIPKNGSSFHVFYPDGQNPANNYFQYAEPINPDSNFYFVRTESSNGCHSFSFLPESLMEFKTNSEVVESEVRFTFYPNPTSGELFIQGDVESINNLSISTLSGINMPVDFIAGNNLVMLPQVLPSSTYVLIIESDLGVQHERIIIVR
jgi:hypothetical protein